GGEVRGGPRRGGGLLRGAGGRAGRRRGVPPERAEEERTGDHHQHRHEGSGAEQQPAASCHVISIRPVTRTRCTAVQIMMCASFRPYQATSAVASSSRSLADQACPPVSPRRICVKLN